MKLIARNSEWTLFSCNNYVNHKSILTNMINHQI